MNLLALPLERDQIFSIKRRFPGFSGKVPEEAAFWSEADLEAYFGSNGRALTASEETVARLLWTGALTQARDIETRDGNLLAPLTGRTAGWYELGTLVDLKKLRLWRSFLFNIRGCRSLGQLELAKKKVDEPTIEYAAFCRHLQSLREDWYRNVKLASVADCCEVQRIRSLEGVALEAPVLLEKQRDWYARFWNLEFFKRDCGHDYWLLSLSVEVLPATVSSLCCLALMRRLPQILPTDGSPDHAPNFLETDEAAAWMVLGSVGGVAMVWDIDAIDQLVLHTNISDFVEFTRTLQRMDRKCDQEKGIAFPRLILDGYAPFFGVLRKFFDECWTKLGPDGLPDLTPRLAHAFAHAFDLQDPMETLSRFYKVTLAATGSITRLHVENAGAHLWFNQIEGRRVFFLFPPSESRKLYEETGGPMQETSGFATRVSGVDLFAPSAKRHPLFAEARCQVAVLYLGQTLVIPSGWWWYSVSLDPSVTLWHQFWTEENKSQFPEIAWEYFNYQKMTPEFWAALPRKVDRLRAARLSVSRRRSALYSTGIGKDCEWQAKA
ncbi:Hspbap1 [Symbiodinium natans]|uniref:Hspbap1 protein n=1 Tax=Symbiodinium natans TaxID=878477 RepID=A0A812P4Z8_9DINO|nr:Hspbap1 [Symbiodinium natans]